MGVKLYKKALLKISGWHYSKLSNAEKCDSNG